MKRIIVCLDGTWNNADGGNPSTNVVQIRDALVSAENSGQIFQRIYYDEGVGTADPIDRIKGGLFGVGLAQNVRQAYKYLSRHYELTDEIYLIGFSRGAHTARSVAGMIGACGLLKRDECTTANEEAMWHYYRTMPKDRPAGDEAVLRARCYPDVRVKCVAVFDTVGTLGIPNTALNWIRRERFAFHDTRIGSTVQHGFHAVAVDEHRSSFKPAMWEDPFNLAGDRPSVEQVWFSGAHSDVGGGNQDNVASRIPLHWMIGRLMSLGVAFDPAALNAAGVEGVASLSPTAQICDSWTWAYRLADSNRRHMRPIKAIAADAASKRGTRALAYRPFGEYLHRSVLDRWEGDPEYRPRNVAAVAAFVGGALPVVDWDGSVMPARTVSENYPAVFEQLNRNMAAGY